MRLTDLDPADRPRERMLQHGAEALSDAELLALFLRVGIMLAGVLLTPLGIRVDYDGWVFVAVSFLSWLAPLAMYEVYLLAERSTRPAVRHVATAAIGLAAVATLAGAVAAAMFMWWPRL